MFNLISRSLPLHLLAIAALCAALYFPALRRIPFYNKGEPREAIVVQSIVLTGNWLFPLKPAEEIPSKPPLFHWLGAATSLLWGDVSEATVRFPSALLGTLGALVVYLLGRGPFGAEAALLGSVILATTVAYGSGAIAARVDMTLAFFVTLTLALFYSLYQGAVRGPAWSYGFYLALGIGVLAKGPVGLVLPLLIISVFLLLRGRKDFLVKLFFHPGFLLSLAVGISWYGFALFRGGEGFFERQIWHENLARFFIRGEGGAGHQKPFYFYLPHLFLGGLPWSLFIPLALAHWVRRASSDQAASREAHLFLAVWVVTVFLFFSIAAGKRPVYLLPLYPALSLLLGGWFAQPTEPGTSDRWFLRSLALFASLMALACVGLLAGGIGSGEPAWFFPLLSALLGPTDQFNLRLLREGLENSRGAFLSFLFLSALFWAFLGRTLWSLRLKAVPPGITALFLILWFVVQGAIVPSVARGKSYAPFMEEVNRQVPEGRLYLSNGAFDKAPLFFYRGTPVPVLEDDLPALAQRLKSRPDYVIMSEQEWLKTRALDGAVPDPILISRGTGPNGDARLVLIRGRA